MWTNQLAIKCTKSGSKGTTGETISQVILFHYIGFEMNAFVLF